MLLLSLLAVTFVLAASTCGGDGGDMAGQEPTAPDVETQQIADDVDVEGLRQEVDEIERAVNDDVAGLSSARSLGELSRRAEAARSELDESAEDLAEVDVSADRELERARGELESAVRELSAGAEDVEVAVSERDLDRALREASGVVEDRERVDSAVAEVRRRLDELAGD
jgi:hypothetical protein